MIALHAERAERRTAFALLVVAVVTALPTLAQAEDNELRDRYQITARLDPARHQIDARATIEWRNRSRVPIKTLFFHLYANAFAHSRTVFMREQGFRLRGAQLERAGGIDVLSLHAADGIDLLAHANRELIHDDATQLRVELERPLAPGASVALQVVFRVRLPSIVARMGASGQFFMVAQWFPKLAKLEPNGAWASFPYHGLGEFYADFADYDLTLTLPRGYTLAAPGEHVSEHVLKSDQVTERYRLNNALDLAWSAYPGYRRVRTQAGGVTVEAFAPAGHTGLARREAELVAEALPRAAARFGAYPYSRLVLIFPPASADGAAGMEYPGLIVGWNAAWYSELNPIARVVHDVVISHELAHQWFPMLVASNELEAPLLDEGLAEWLGLDLVRARYDREFFRRVAGLDSDLFELEHANYASAQLTPSSLQPAYAYRVDQLARAVYLRPCLLLESVRRSWGPARLDAALSAYARRYRYAHPRFEDFFAAFDRDYWPGFGEQVLRPTLEAQPLHKRPQPDPYRHDLIDRVTDSRGSSSRVSPQPHPLLARMLLLAQSVLSLVGP